MVIKFQKENFFKNPLYGVIEIIFDPHGKYIFISVDEICYFRNVQLSTLLERDAAEITSKVQTSLSASEHFINMSPDNESTRI